MKEKLIEYAELKRQSAEIEEQIEALKPEVEAAVLTLNPEDETVLVEGIGTFSMFSRRTYTYPSDIEEAENKLKERKKETEANGEATYTEKKTLRFTTKTDISQTE